MEFLKAATGLILTILFLVGCVHFVPKPIAPVETVSHFEQRSFNDPGLHGFLLKSLPDGEAGPWPVPVWNVDSLALAALYFRPDMELMRARWATTKAAKITAGQYPNPVLSIAPQYNITSSKISPWIYPATLEVRIETFGKRSARLRRTNQLARSSWWKIVSTAWRIRYEVQQSLLTFQAANESVQVIQEQLRVHHDLVNRIQAQREVGEISSFELAQSQTTLQTLRLTHLDTERQKNEAETQLAAAIGVPASTIKAINIRLMPLDQVLPEISTQEARFQALIHRPDILSALAEYEATQEKLQLEIARQYPDIRLGPGYEFDQDDNKWGLGVSITLPVLNQNEGPIAEAEARRIEAAAKFNVLQARVIGEIDTAVVAFRSQTKTVAAAEMLLSIFTQQERRIRTRKEAGELSRLDELSARATLLKAKRDLLRTRVRQRQSYYMLENALQGAGILPESFSYPPTDTVVPVSNNS